MENKLFKINQLTVFPILTSLCVIHLFLESFQGYHGSGKYGEPTKPSEPIKSTNILTKSPSSSSKTLKSSDDVLEKPENLKSNDFASSGAVENEIPSYEERKKFWEQMSSSSSTEISTDVFHGVNEKNGTFESVEQVSKVKETTVKEETIQKSHDVEEIPESEEGSLVKSLTKSYSKKIAAGELIMPAIPRPISKIETESISKPTDFGEKSDSSGGIDVSELETKIKSHIQSVPTQEMKPESIQPPAIDKKGTKKEKDLDAELLDKKSSKPVVLDTKGSDNQEDIVNLPLSERKKIFENITQEQPIVGTARKSSQDKSVPLLAQENVENIIVKEQIESEQVPNQMEEASQKIYNEQKVPKRTSIEKEFGPLKSVTEQLTNATVVQDKILTQVVGGVGKIISKIPTTLGIKEIHVEKNEVEDNEKPRIEESRKMLKKEDIVPTNGFQGLRNKQIETLSVGGSEDTQSESDITPEEARVLDTEDSHWDVTGFPPHELPPKDDFYCPPKDIGESGIGRWVGQEDLSKQFWDKDDVDTSEYKEDAKWQRSRSETASPKEHYVYTPEEHYPEIPIWEVPIQELQNSEMTHDLPIEKQVIVEKDEEEEEENEISGDKIKLTEEEAKEMAEEVLEYIQYEVENRSSFLTNDDEDEHSVIPPEVTDQLRQLVEKKDLDLSDVEAIEKALMKDKRQIVHKPHHDILTTASSIDITDEELKSTGVENDISPTQSQLTKLSLDEDILQPLPLESESEPPTVVAEKVPLKDEELLDQTIAEVKESLEAAQEQLIEQHKKRKKTEFLKKESPSEFEFKDMSCGKGVETIRQPSSEFEKLSECETIIEEGEPVVKGRIKGVQEKFDVVITDEKAKESTVKSIEGKADPSLGSSSLTAKASVLKQPHFGEPDLFDISAKNTHQYYSEESTRSTSVEDSLKSPPQPEESLPHDKHTEIKTETIFRHSPSSTLLRGDRRSGAELEPYSSSGESHHQSFEQTSSRPCSSDVEALLGGNVGTTGSSDYESALSHEVSSKQLTTADYHTAVSSLSSRDSIKSLDSESSGNLASVEISSEASETLVQSTLELDKDADTPEMMIYEEVRSVGRSRKTSKTCSRSTEQDRPRGDEDFEIISESEVASLGGEISEEDDGNVAEEAFSDDEYQKKMKRSYEMTFQPVPKPISAQSDSFYKDEFGDKLLRGASVDESSSVLSLPDDKMAPTMDDTGSILSTSVSTTSDGSAVRTVIELSHSSDKMETSLTASGTSIDSVCHEEPRPGESGSPKLSKNDTSTATTLQGTDKKVGSVTMTTCSSEELGVSYVSTQITSVSRKSSMVGDVVTDCQGKISTTDRSDSSLPQSNEAVDEAHEDAEATKPKRTQGHRRKESTSNFVPSMIWNLNEAKTQILGCDFTQVQQDNSDDKYVGDVMLTEKEVKNDEKKEADDSEKVDGCLEKYAEERKISDGEEVEEFSKDYEYMFNGKIVKQSSKTDSESGRQCSSLGISEDQPDSMISDIMKQGSSETDREDILERPLSPEPEDIENKDITPEFSSEAQASVTELEMEYSGAYSRRDEYASHVSPIREERSDVYFVGQGFEAANEDEKMNGNLSHQASQESTVAEKHELETREKEIFEDNMKDSLSKGMPKITVDHFSGSFQDDKTTELKTSLQTLDSTTTFPDRTSDSLDQGKECIMGGSAVNDAQPKLLIERKSMGEAKEDKESVGTPSSDSFEMLDKPDISDEYVIIEEVGREAQESDKEGKSIQILTGKKTSKMSQEESKDQGEETKVSPPAAKMTDLKYYPKEDDSDMFTFDSDSPPQNQTRKFVEKLKRRPSKEEKDIMEYEDQIEQSKRWVEMQFQGEQAAKIIGAYGYEMEYERAPLEDIKEEDLTELDGSSKIGSMGSQKESIGSFSSVKDSFSSTPDYDVLAGKKYFTRSGEHDDVSMSSLQEFELIEKKIMENNGKKSGGSSSSQESLSSKKLGTSSKSGQGDDISLASLREFENLEKACATVVEMESKAKQGEAILSEIDEGHESQISESESCETVSAVMRGKLESECEDLDKKMFEIDEIMKQAQTNVEKFAELQSLEKIESMGRGDSLEEVAKVPDLELDTPLSGRLDKPRVKVSKIPYSTQVVTKKTVQQWREEEGKEEAQRSDTESLEHDAYRQGPDKSQTNYYTLNNGGKTKSNSVDSLQLQSKEKQLAAEPTDDAISLDSYKSKSQKSDPYDLSEFRSRSDSMEDVSNSLKHLKSGSGDYTLSGRDGSGELSYRPPPRAEFAMGSTDSLDPSSSAGTHATYQYETDSVMSSSFTSGDSNTMVSSRDNLEFLVADQSALDFAKDFKPTNPEEWLKNLTLKSSKSSKLQTTTEFEKIFDQDVLREMEENLGPNEEIVNIEETDEFGNLHVKKILRQKYIVRQGDPEFDELHEAGKSEMDSQPKIMHAQKLILGHGEEFVTETVEPLNDVCYSHIVHRTTQMAPEVEKIIFKGPDAEKSLKDYAEGLGTNDEIEETREVDEHGNVHVKRVIRQKILVTSAEATGTASSKATYSGQNLIPATENLSYVQGITSREASGSEEVRIVPGKFTRNIEGEITQITPEISKIKFEGPDAEQKLQEYIKSLGSEPDVEEIEETDELGNVHKKKILKQRVVVKSGDLEEEILKCLGQAQTGIKMPSTVTKIEFSGPDAEARLEDFIRGQQPEFEELEQVDEDGNVHRIKVMKRNIVVRPEEFQKTMAGDRISSTEIQKLSFKDEEALQEYIASMGSGEDVVEVEEKDEHGNVHIKKILRQRVVVKQGELDDQQLAGNELHEYIRSQLKTTAQPVDLEMGVCKQVEISPGIQKLVFSGPNADEACKEYMEAFDPGEEIEEIEEVDEDGNVHIKRCLKRKILIAPNELEKLGLTGEDLNKYLQELEHKTFATDDESFNSSFDPNLSGSQSLTEAFTRQLIETTGRLTYTLYAVNSLVG